MRVLTRTLLIPILLSLGARAQDAGTSPPIELGRDWELTRGGATLTPRAFFVLAGRDDLVEKSDRNLLRRRWLIGTSLVVLVASAVVGAVIIAMTPDIKKPYCLARVEWYNECVYYEDLYNHGGTATIIGGAFLAGMLATLGWLSRPEVLPMREFAPLVDRYNEDH
jgi:hypothetical protein